MIKKVIVFLYKYECTLLKFSCCVSPQNFEVIANTNIVVARFSCIRS